MIQLPKKLVFLALLLVVPGGGLAIAEDHPCYPIREIRVDKNSILRRRVVKRLTRKFHGLCAEPDVLNLILRTLTSACLERGYITSRAMIEPQKIDSGVVQIHILEGRMEAIEFDEASRNNWSVFDKAQILTAFAGFKHAPLNLRDIEQGLAQMNRLSSKRVTMKIFPGSKEGYSKIILTDHGGQSQVHVKTSLDNSGQESTGVHNVRINVEQDDLMKLNDSWAVSYSQSAKKATSEKQSQSFSLSVSVPCGRWRASASLAKSDYSTFIYGTNERIQNSGKGLQQYYKIDRSVYRGKNQTLSLWTQLNLKGSESFIEDVKSDAGSRNLTVLKFGVNHNCVGAFGFLNAAAAYHRGMIFLGAKADEAPLTPFTPRAQFDKLDLSFSCYKPFRLLGRNLYFKSSVSGQYAFAPLYSSERIVIGDAYSVRGFKQSSGFGDQGFSATNDIGFSLPGFLTESWGLNSALRKTEWFAGFDFGQARHFGGKAANFGQGESFLTGWATGLRFKGKLLYCEVTYAQSVHTEDFIGNSQEIYAMINLNLF